LTGSIESFHPAAPRFAAEKVVEVCEMIFLETDRLLFRSHQSSDEEGFIAMHTDAEVRRYVGGQAWSLAKTRDRFRDQYLGRPTRTYGLWAAVLKEERRYIGCCGLRNASEENAAYLAYYLARPYWGRGLASEAAAAFIEIAFAQLHLPRLLADVDEGHVVSKHILEKFRFRFLRNEEIAASGRVLLFYELLRESQTSDAG
jgi:ribosomal-protein-alanine N-acetyltransferase